jgi:lipid A 3-O-deacylase
MLNQLDRFWRALLGVAFLAMADDQAAQGADGVATAASRGRPASGSSPSFVSEVRLGVLAHDPDSPEAGSADLNAEILFAKPIAVADPLWNSFVPRPHLGTTLGFDGRTSFAYAGLTWSVDIWRGTFVEASFGGAVNNGATGTLVPEDRNAMGCNISFRESGSLGYRLTESLSLMATIEHYSNAGLCEHNRGLTNFGVRLGYRF